MGMHDELLEVLRRWAPRRRDDWSERAYSDDLCATLETELPESGPRRSVKTRLKRFPHGRRADLKLDGSTGPIYIEMKLDLKGANEVNRLVGQIESILFRNDNARVVVVLCGHTSDQDLDFLRSWARKQVSQRHQAPMVGIFIKRF